MKLVLFLNMGGATSFAQCEQFLKNMFNDKYILTIQNDYLRAFVAFFITKFRRKAMWQNYQKIGGKSPLNDITARLCEKLNKEFESVNFGENSRKHSQNSPQNSKNLNFHFDFINTYVPPFADSVLAKYELTKDDEIVLFPLYPHQSQTTTISALERTKNAILKAKIPAKISEIPIFFTNEIYNEMLINHILSANEAFKKGQKKTLVFSVHSLPISTIKSGDIYQEHIESHFEALKKRLSAYFDEIILGYQSKVGPVKWLTPTTASLLAGLKNDALVYPLAFCIDCSESVYELDIEYRKIAARDYFVVPCPNDSTDFVGFIKAYLKDKVW